MEVMLRQIIALLWILTLGCLIAGCGGTPEQPKSAPPPKQPDTRLPEGINKSGPGGNLFAQLDPEKSADDKATVVKVFYATDRAAISVDAWRRSLRAGWPWLAGAMALIAVGLWFWRRRRTSRIVQAAAWAATAVTALLVLWTLIVRFQGDLTGREIARMYGNDRGKLELGVCEVSVPHDHQVGELESPSVLRLEFRPDPEKHVVLTAVRQQPADEFFGELRRCVGRSSGKEVLVFVHGYNVGFETAARRTAQIAYDLKFDGAPIFYSWPSQEGLLAYTVDETNVAWTVPHLKEFLLDVARKSQAEAVHLIAHSMGNRALTSALRELTMELKSDCPRFHEVVLTAPDIDAEVFTRDIVPAIVQTADRVTLYASSNDEALLASKAVHGYRRAGDAGEAVVVIPGIDTVDVSEVDTSFIGHSYYGSNSTVLADLFELMHGSKPPQQRKWLHSIPFGALKYWKFLRDRALDIPELIPPRGEEL